MKALSGTAVLLALSVVGCGTTEKGPAQPKENATTISQDQVKESYSKGPPEAQKMYEKYKKGGS
jgi:hypothetical protein